MARKDYDFIREFSESVNVRNYFFSEGTTSKMPIRAVLYFNSIIHGLNNPFLYGPVFKKNHLEIEFLDNGAIIVPVGKYLPSHTFHHISKGRKNLKDALDYLYDAVSSRLLNQ